ncbi:AAA domain-containing protein [Fibrobacter sp. HC4]|uniref:AAA domain-containing protein n=1 Tax=Fibrobacter sp. HC4 TaxID=3239812 RepID=UPI002019DC5C|nr:AAA domain-containing protein [Fibrobacter succinogenes]MCL4102101.1 ATP-dependent RecD-like DNA helicase [Fibrobacter succinogenes]
MNPREVLVLIKGEIKTEEVESLSFDDASRKCKVVFRNGNAYEYSAGNVVCLNNPCQHEFQNQKISVNGIELYNIENIYEFCDAKSNKKYWHIVFKDKAKTYKCDELKILNETKDSFQSVVLNYLKDVAANNPLLVQEFCENENKKVDASLLQKQYDKIKGIYEGEDTALALYLKSGAQKDLQTTETRSLVFPFGCNLSQINAVQNAFKYTISLIQGPPGTGKTQTILNILANLLIQGKTALVVSNNNSAIKNVQEKLSQYKLDFLSAMLGKDENKTSFIESQKPRKLEHPIEKNRPSLASWQKNILKKVFDAKRLFSEQNELARVKTEFESARVNYEHFKDYLDELGISDYSIENRNDLNQFDMESVRSQLESNLKNNPSRNKFSFFTRVWLRFVKGLSNWKFLKGDVAAIIASLENFCFVIRLAEYRNRVNSLEKSVKANEHAASDLLSFSKSILYENVFRKFNLRKEQTIYTKDDLYRKWSEFLQDYPIIFSTTFASKSALSPNAIFDYVIMDESSQVDIATGALAISCAKNAVIVGDSKQLEKVTTREEKEKYQEIFEKHKVPQMYNCADVSFLDSIGRFIPETAKTLLKEHYRCHPKIIEFCNQKFYDNQLVVLSSNTEQNPLVIHWTAPTGRENNVNQKQIEAIAREVMPTLKTTDVGIISPYNKQCSELRKVVPNIDISTIHKFQGREKDSIIFSTVDNVLTEFSGDPQTINVAVSRAKNKFILVTSKQEQPKGSILDDLIGYIQYNAGESVESKVYSIFDVLFSQKCCTNFRNMESISKYPSENIAYRMIRDVLKSCPSLDVFFEYPMNHLIRDFSKIVDNLALLSYAKHPSTHIDFLITNRISKTPVLAIEIDGANFHKQESVQAERDRMKDCILERYGIDYVRFSTKGSNEREQLESKLKAYMVN